MLCRNIFLVYRIHSPKAYKDVIITVNKLNRAEQRRYVLCSILTTYDDFDEQKEEHSSKVTSTIFLYTRTSFGMDRSIYDF